MDPVTRPWDPTISRSAQRLTIVYATSAHTHDPLPSGRLTDQLRLGRLAGFYDHSAAQLPRVIFRTDLPVDAMAFRRRRDYPDQLQSAVLWALTLPSDRVLIALTLNVDVELIQTIPILEDLYYADIEISGLSLQDWSLQRIESLITGRIRTFLPERHQLIFSSISDEAHAPSADTIQRLIYRADVPSRPGSDAIQLPSELNRRPTSVGAVGAYVSVIAGHQDYLENTAFLSVVQVVGSAAELREIRERAYECVRDFRTHQDDQVTNTQRRIELERLSDLLSELELTLSFNVEASADLGLLIPSLRVESYHNDLYYSMNLSGRAETTGHMLARLNNAITAELASVTSVETRVEDARRMRTVAAVTFISTIGGTLALLFGFFGVNASQVDDHASMFDKRYLPIYLLVVAIAGSAAGIYAVLSWRERRFSAHPRRPPDIG